MAFIQNFITNTAEYTLFSNVYGKVTKIYHIQRNKIGINILEGLKSYKACLWPRSNYFHAHLAYLPFFSLSFSHEFRGEFSRIYIMCDITTYWMQKLTWESNCLLLSYTLKLFSKNLNSTTLLTDIFFGQGLFFHKIHWIWWYIRFVHYYFKLFILISKIPVLISNIVKNDRYSSYEERFSLESSITFKTTKGSWDQKMW